MSACLRCVSRIRFITSRASIAHASRYLVKRNALFAPSGCAKGLTSTSPRLLDQQLHSIDVFTSHGTREQVRVMPSYPNKPKAVETLLNGLREILSAGSTSSPVVAYETSYWILDKEGNAIHRHFELYDQKAVQNLVASVKVIADETNHHPHYSVQGHLLTITCATHVPPGLSMKDVKLARRINQVYNDFKASQPKVATAGVEQREIDMLRTYAETQNNLEIQKAKETCECAS